MIRRMNYYIGIDVGTGSARAGLFDQNGTLEAMATREIQMWKPEVDYYEQSSDDIWKCICECAKKVMQESGVAPAAVKGLGFDATCSLVALDGDGEPVTLSPDGVDAQNVIVWMDHRALKETDEVNAFNTHEVFDYVGGKISPEMQTPKLLWLKRHMPESWQRTRHFFDLPDFLTYKATGQWTRSLCSTVCKWTYLGHENKGWQDDFFTAVGLGDLVEEGYARIGNDVKPMGEPIPGGLSQEAATELGLVAGTAVAVSLIDAHAGGVGMLGLGLEGEAVDFDKRLALIGGTSSCHMAVSPQMRKIPGVWGPYYSAMVPEMWLNEGGQSAVGSLIDHVVYKHAAYPEAQQLADAEGVFIFQYLNQHLERLAGQGNLSELTRKLHVCPYFHGNRSPRANPRLKGMISGLSLSSGLDDLALLYLATVQAVAYGTRHIIEAMDNTGYQIDTIVACGGGTKNAVFMQQHADASGCRIVLPKEKEAVLLGSAMLGACAAGEHPDLASAMREMAKAGQIIEPQSELKAFHDQKYAVFAKMYQDQCDYAELMGYEL
ncbi:MAG: FGGY-family carbohydrate kinase [Verrucomicrobia bacterium]|nr:FGGY-family carbohydrate kinase [Verrucomicrobiota bacterium]